MVGRKLLLALLFLCGSVSAGDLANIRWQVVNMCDLDDTAGTSQITKAAIDSIINLGCRTLSDDFPEALVKQDTITLVRSTWLYSLNSDILQSGDVSPLTFVHRVEYLSDTTEYPLQIVTQENVYSAIMGTDNATIPSKGDSPRLCWVSAGKLIVWPTPRKTGQLVIGYRANQGTLGSSDTLRIDQVFEYPLIVWSAARIKDKLGAISESQSLQGQYDRLVAKRRQTQGTTTQ